MHEGAPGWSGRLSRSLAPIGGPHEPAPIFDPPPEEHTARLASFLDHLHHIVETVGPQDDLGPVPGRSPMAGDDGYPGDYPLSGFAQIGMGACVENLASLYDQLVRSTRDDPVRISSRAFGPFALVRAAMESAAQVCWALEPDGRWDRLARRLGIQWDEIWAQDQAMNDLMYGAKEGARAPLLVAGMGDDEIAQRYERGRARLRGRRQGIRQLVRDAPAGLSWGMVQRASQESRWTPLFQTLEAADSHLEQWRLRFQWWLCAGLSHSREWAQLAVLDHHPVDLPPTAGITGYARGMNYAYLATCGDLAIYLLVYAQRLYTKRCTPYR